MRRMMALLPTGNPYRLIGMKPKYSLMSTELSSTTHIVRMPFFNPALAFANQGVQLLMALRIDHNDEELRRNKAQLSSLITEVLRRYPYLCYFQGYHDICQVFLLVLDPAWRARTVARLSVLRIRDFMLPTLGPTTAQLQLLPEIIGRADPKLQQHLAAVQPFYALSSTLTMFAHNIEAYHDIARLFDVLIAREPVFSIYLFAQMIINRRDEVMDIDEPDMLHVILGKVPPNLNLDVLITDSVALHDRHPPSSLRSWRHMSNASVLKTVSNVEVCSGQTMEQGHEYFKQQVKEIQWFELQEKAKMLLWAYRKPAATMGLAVGVGLIGVYLQRNPSVLRFLLTLLKQR
jgi:TBC1 domain family member 20